MLELSHTLGTVDREDSERGRTRTALREETLEWMHPGARKVS